MKNGKLVIPVILPMIMVLAVPAVSYAGSPSSAEQTVFVAHDITRQSGYTVTYKHYDKNGNLIWSKQFEAPANSMFEIKEEPLSNAENQHELYVLKHGDTSEQEQEIQQAIDLVRDKNPAPNVQSTSNVIVPQLSAGQTATVTGSFSCGTYNTRVQYSINYGAIDNFGDMNIYWETTSLSNPVQSGKGYIEWKSSQYKYFPINITYDCGYEPIPVSPSEDFKDFGSTFQDVESGNQFWTYAYGHDNLTTYAGYITLN